MQVRVAGAAVTVSESGRGQPLHVHCRTLLAPSAKQNVLFDEGQRVADRSPRSWCQDDRVAAVLDA